MVNTQDALAVVRARGKGIHVQPLVVGTPGLLTDLHLHGPETRGRQPQRRHVVRQQRANELQRLLAIAQYHGRERGLRGGIARRALETPVHVEADVARAGGADVGAQKAFFLLGQRKGQRGEEQHLAGLHGYRPFRPTLNLVPVGRVNSNDFRFHGIDSVPPQSRVQQAWRDEETINGAAAPSSATAPPPRRPTAARTAPSPGCATA